VGLWDVWSFYGNLLLFYDPTMVNLESFSRSQMVVVDLLAELDFFRSVSLDLCLKRNWVLLFVSVVMKEVALFLRD